MVNKYDVSGEHGVGWTSKNEEFWFDLEDYNMIKKYSWYYEKSTGYVRTNIRDENNKRTHMYLHRLVMKEIPSGCEVDHINHPKGNEHKVDNRKSNLRFVTRSQNNINKDLQKNNRSGHKGVFFNTFEQKWVGTIQFKRKRYSKYCSSYEEACDWYDKMAMELHTEYMFNNTNN